jgi:hypothetical protein
VIRATESGAYLKAEGLRIAAQNPDQYLMVEWRWRRWRRWRWLADGYLSWSCVTILSDVLSAGDTLTRCDGYREQRCKQTE